MSGRNPAAPARPLEDAGEQRLVPDTVGHGGEVDAPGRAHVSALGALGGFPDDRRDLGVRVDIHALQAGFGVNADEEQP
ncbi:hypothetical protein ABZ023_10555 [Streptomyces sp. NPDC006367]|uniref:hypothetical protein n=1 Tax=unclassified Streptomyces TaxID=2593676 RepID=UPI0033B929BF